MTDNNPPSNDQLDTFSSSNDTNMREEYVPSHYQQNLLGEAYEQAKMVANYPDKDMQDRPQDQSQSQKPTGHDLDIVQSQTSKTIQGIQKKLSSKKVSSTQSIIRMSKQRSDRLMQNLKHNSIKVPKSVIPSSQSIIQTEDTQTSDTTSELGLTVVQELQTTAQEVYQQITQSDQQKDQLNNVVSNFNSFAQDCMDELKKQRDSKQTLESQINELYLRLNTTISQFNTTVQNIKDSFITLETNAKNLFTQGYSDNIFLTKNLTKKAQAHYEEIAQVLDAFDVNFQQYQKDLEEIRDYTVSQFENLTIDITQWQQTTSNNIDSITTHFSNENSKLIQLVKNQQEYFVNLISKNTQEFQEIIRSDRQRYNENFLHVNKELQYVTEQLKQLTVKTDITYFKCNTLVENDRLVKEGLTHSKEKVNNVVDLMETAKNFISRHVSSSVNEELNEGIKDSAISMLKTKKPISFPNVEKVRDFVNDQKSLVDSERGINLQSREQKLQQEYRQQYEQFIRAYPGYTMVFTNPTARMNSPKEEEEIIEEYNPQEQGTSKNYLPSFKLPKTNTVQFDSKPQITIEPKDEPKYTLPRILKSSPKPYTSPPIESSPKDKSFHKFMDDVSRFNTNRRDVSYVPIMEKKIHKFQFRTQFSRSQDPVIWMFQYESNCDACYFSPQDKCTQLVNVLQGEYLDWYKQRLRTFTGTDKDWPILKDAFLKQYTKPTLQAREELFECKQYLDESLYSFLERLRSITRTSELDDSHIKDQLVRGMRDRNQKLYVTQIQEFTKEKFDEYTSTTLVEKIEKHTRKFRLMDPKVSEKNTQNKPPYYKPRLVWKNRQPQQNNSKPINKKVTTPKVTSVEEQKPTTSIDTTSEEEVNDELVDKVNSTFQHLFDIDLIEQEHESESDQSQQRSPTQLGTIWVSDRLSLDQVNTLSNSPSQTISKQVSRDLQSLQDKTVNAMKTHSSKLYSYADKGKELPKLSYDTFRSSQHIYLPEKQLLQENPTQFLHAVKFLHDILKDSSHLLNTPTTLTSMQNFMTALAARNSDLLYSKPEQQTPVTSIQAGEESQVIDTINTVLHAKPINFLCYINVIVQGVKVSAMIDTGSTATIISEKVFKDKNMKIPEARFYRQCILADGSKTVMSEWNNISIRLDKYLEFKCDMLISRDVNFDMIFGLNSFLAINGTLTSSELKYSYENNGKRWGTIPLVKVYGPNEKQVSFNKPNTK